MTATIEIESELVELARNAARRGNRTEAQQIADWARLGMSLERVITPEGASAADLRRALDAANTPEAQERVRRELAASPFPRYSSDPESKDGLIEHRPDGMRVSGRLVGRTFVLNAEAAST